MNIDLQEKQIKQIARSISVSSIKAYIEQHRFEYEQFLKDEEENKEKNKRSSA